MNREFPKVVIVTPSYNQGQFLEQTIRSVLDQDYPNIEYVVMDGGSTDNSVEILRKYSDRISYWISEKDSGQSNAINKGWKREIGEFCAYLNSDDLLAPGAVSAVVKAFLANPRAGVINGDYTFIDELGNVMDVGKGASTNFRKLLMNGQMPAIAQPSSFYRAALVKQVNYADESLRLSMDYDLLLKLARISEVYYIPKCLSFFRMHVNAKSSTMMKKHWHESLKVGMKYNKLYLIGPLLRYIRFRVFHWMPTRYQNKFRRSRKSINDKLIIAQNEHK